MSIDANRQQLEKLLETGQFNTFEDDIYRWCLDNKTALLS
jgi:hypothetical protein